MSGVVAATVARLISEGGGVNTGMHFLMDAVDPVTFMEELRKVGVYQMKSFETGGCEPRAEGGAAMIFDNGH